MLISTNPRIPGTGVRSLLAEVAPSLDAAPGNRVWRTVLALTAAGAVALLMAAHGGEFVRAIDRALHAGWQLVAVAAAFEAASIAGYVMLLHRVVARADSRLRLKDSYDVTLGGAAATRLLPTAGLGGAAVTVWALRARGVRSGVLAERLLAFLILLYGVYIAALLTGGVVVGLGWVHVNAGGGLGLLGAAIALAVAAIVRALLVTPSPLARALDRLGRGSGRLGSVSRRAVSELPVLRAAVRCAGRELRRPHPAVLGTVAWWGFDIAVLVTMLYAFGVQLPLAAVVLAYFLGTLFNVVPFPGSLSGGLAGALIALGSPAGGALAAVLAYRAVAVWLPVLPGMLALASLRRSVPSWRRDTGSRTPSAEFPV